MREASRVIGYLSHRKQSARFGDDGGRLRRSGTIGICARYHAPSRRKLFRPTDIAGRDKMVRKFSSPPVVRPTQSTTSAHQNVCVPDAFPAWSAQLGELNTRAARAMRVADVPTP